MPTNACVAIRRIVTLALTCVVLGACGSSSSPTASTPTPVPVDYAGTWIGRGNGWTIDTLNFTVQGQQITAMRMMEDLSLDPLVNLGGGQFAFWCRRTFTLTSPVNITNGAFQAALSVADVAGAITIRGTFSSASAASGTIDAFTAQNVCGYTSSGTTTTSTWTATRQ